MAPCPCCGSGDFAPAVPCDAIARETDLRTHFMARRTNGCVGGQDLKDRTSFTHDRVVALYGCRGCGLLVRGDRDDDFTARYAGDEYEPEVLEHFLQRDVRFFAPKAGEYAAMLPPGARVVEVGSYAGGFLHAAAARGWHATGIDIGEDVARFANERGYPTLRTTLEDSPFADGSLDAVFVWNCFDQLPDPNRTLAAARRLLRPGGLLVLRTPNALFYRLCQPLLALTAHQAAPEAAEATIARVMGYNNLLGFPYQYGYAPPHLRRMIERHGFAADRFVPSHLLMLPEAEAPAWALDEQRATIHLLADLAAAVAAFHDDVVASPWMELVAHRSDAAGA